MRVKNADILKMLSLSCPKRDRDAIIEKMTLRYLGNFDALDRCWHYNFRHRLHDHLNTALNTAEIKALTDDVHSRALAERQNETNAALYSAGLDAIRRLWSGRKFEQAFQEALAIHRRWPDLSGLKLPGVGFPCMESHRRGEISTVLLCTAWSLSKAYGRPGGTTRLIVSTAIM
jgi:hypothetical protein